MNTTVIVLIVLAVIYVPIWIWALKSPRAKDVGIETYGPALKVNSRLGIRTMERLSRYRRFWNAYGLLSQAIQFGLMAAMVFLMAMAVYRLPQTLQVGGVGIQYALALPGLNPIMPFWFTLFALIVAVVLHEMAHGLQARANGIPVIHTGLLYGVVPLGAFVEPDDEVTKRSSRKARLHLAAAGIATNFIIGAVSFLIFSSVLLGGLHSPYDDGGHHMAGVYSNMDSDGIPAGAVIIDFDGRPYDYSQFLSPRDTAYWDPASSVTVHYDTEGEKGLAKQVVWGVYIAVVSADSPAQAAGLEKGDVICSVTGPDGDAKYLYSAEQFSKYMAGTGPGDQVAIGYYDRSAGGWKEITVDLASKDGIGFLGVSVNTAGMALATPSQVLDIATNPFYGRDSVPDRAVGMFSYLSNPFSGFSPVPDSIHWWYEQPFSGFWILACIFYWLFWLNILLGVTNALPAMPFDGGLIFRDWVGCLLERYGGTRDPDRREVQLNEITRNISTMMLVLLIVVILSAVL